MPKPTYICKKCEEEFILADMTDILFIEHGTGGEKRQVSKVRVCKDCAEKAETVLADAMELPDWG